MNSVSNCIFRLSPQIDVCLGNLTIKTIFLCLYRYSFLISLFIVTANLFAVGNVEIDLLTELLTEMEADRENWLENASFCGNFTYKQKEFSSEEDALNSKIDNHNLRLNIKGLVCKQGEKYRIHFYQPEAANDYSADFPSSAFIDKVANHRYLIEVQHYKNGKKPNDLFNGSFSLNTQNPIEAISSSNNICAPWLFFKEAAASPPVGGIIESNIQYTQTDDQHILLALQGEFSNHQKWVKEIVVRSDMEKPTVEIIKTVTYDTDEKNILKTNIQRVLEWKRCNGFDIPTSIRTSIGIHRSQGDNNQEFWLASEWESKDIGKRQPRDKDFTISLEEGDVIAHLRHYPKNHLLDIDAVTEGDYDPNFEAHSPVSISGISPQKNFFIRLIFLTVGLIFIILAVFRIYKKRVECIIEKT